MKAAATIPEPQKLPLEPRKRRKLSISQEYLLRDWMDKYRDTIAHHTDTANAAAASKELGFSITKEQISLRRVPLKIEKPKPVAPKSKAETVLLKLLDNLEHKGIISEDVAQELRRELES